MSQQPDDTPVAVRWGHPGAERTALVVGDDALVHAVAAILPRGAVAPSGDEVVPLMVVARERAVTIVPERLRHAQLVILLDPSEADRLASVHAMAGRREARLVIVPSLASISVAEHALLLILALARRLLPAYSDVVGGVRRPGLTSRLTGPGEATANWAAMPQRLILTDRSLGILGLGRTGTALAERAVALGMRVLYHDLVAKPATEARLGVIPRRLDQLLREADVVSLHLPLTEATTRLVDAPELAVMKPDALLINTAHGRIIDEGSLIKALRGRYIAGAGLDVFAYEPLPENSPLLTLDNVVLTPHVAGVSPETERAHFARRVAQELARLVGDVEDDQRPSVRSSAPRSK